jgi:hypothetical protein
VIFCGTIEIDNGVCGDFVKPTREGKSLMFETSDVFPCAQKYMMRKVFGVMPMFHLNKDEAVDFRKMKIVERAESFGIAVLCLDNELLLVHRV